jgi:hypothetical protein
MRRRNVARRQLLGLIAVIAISSVMLVVGVSDVAIRGGVAGQRQSSTAARVPAAGLGPRATPTHSTAPTPPSLEVHDIGADLRTKLAASKTTASSANPSIPITRDAVEVTLRGDPASIAKAVQKAGGRVIASVLGMSTVVVPAGNESMLRTSPGVRGLIRPVRAVAQGATSEGIAASGATAWQATEQANGIGIGVVDAGFRGLAAAQAPGGVLTGANIVYGGSQNHCADDSATSHGTAVIDIVHQMAPGATLYLYCVDDNIGFSQAGAQAQASNLRIVTSSLSFPGDSRGDGSGFAISDPGQPDDGADYTTATTVRLARQAGILWIQSAGNEGTDHVGGMLTSPDPNGFAPLSQTYGTAIDYIDIPAGSQASVYLQWDQWPVSSMEIGLVFGPVDSNGRFIGTPIVVDQAPGTTPVLSACVTPGGTHAQGCWDSNTFTSNQQFGIAVDLGYSGPPVAFSLTYWGSASADSMSCGNPFAPDCSRPVASPGSVSTPADSPYAFAVGASDASGYDACGSDQPYSSSATTHLLESFSGVGPTIDGRTKPDLLGYDGVASSVLASPFCGTSAAAPHVAGAAALILAENPGFTADQLENALRTSANQGLTSATADAATIGSGLLTLSPVAVIRSVSPMATAALIGVDLARFYGGVAGTLSIQPYVSGIAFGSPVILASPQVGSNFVTVPSLLPGTSYAFQARLVGGTAGSSPASSLSTTAAVGGGSGTGDFVPVGPVRIFDSRDSNEPWNPGETRSVLTTGLGGVPSSGVAAVAISISVVNPSASGYLTVWPDGVSRPIATTINFVAGQTKTASTKIPVTVGSGGRIWIYNFSGVTGVTLDVVGFYSDASGTFTHSLSFGAVTPVRVLDTRNGVSFSNGSVQTVTVRGGTTGVPVTASAVELNVEAVGPSSAGYLTLWPDGTTRPTVSNLLYEARRTIETAVLASVGADGKVAIYSHGSTDVVVDIVGYYDVSAPSRYVAVTPVREYDTRDQSSPISNAKFAAGETRAITLAGVFSIPSSATGIVFSATAVNNSSASYLTVWPLGQPRPLAADLLPNAPNTLTDNLVVCGLTDLGVDVFNYAGQTDLVIDVVGYFI